MIKPQPMIVLADVEAGSRWFQAVLGLSSGHGGPEYEMLLDGEELVAQLHHWETETHPHLGDASDPSRGNGVLLWFATDDFDAAMARVEGNAADVLDGPLVNPNAEHREVWLRGPEGYGGGGRGAVAAGTGQRAPRFRRRLKGASRRANTPLCS